MIGCNIEFVYDENGNLTSECIEAMKQNISQAVKRIQRQKQQEDAKNTADRIIANCGGINPIMENDTTENSIKEKVDE